MAWSPSGTLLAAGLGDGNIPIFSIENRNLVLAARLLDGHMSSVAFVMFPTFAKGNERLVLSGGSDGSILGWDVGTNLMELATMENPKELFHDYEFITTSGGPSLGVDGLTYQTEELSLGNPRILFSIPHGSKVNWMTTSGNSIFVADTSHDITEYKLPLR
jgi:WD40 repeat protein